MIPPEEKTRVPTPKRQLRELPPRHLDWFTQVIVFCGDRLSQAGWWLLALGSVVFWTTVLQSEVKMQWNDRNASWQEKAGVVLQVDSTMTFEDGQCILHNHYSFAWEGYRYRGMSYSVGRKFDEGQIAYIRFDAKRPENSYIIGTRRRHYSGQVRWLLLIPLLGIPLVLWPIRRNWRFLRLLKIGDWTRGSLMKKAPTGRVVTDGALVLPEFRYSFEFQHNSTKYVATCNTHRTNEVEDEALEAILFDKYNPTFNLVYDAVPNVPPIQPDGKMESVSIHKSWKLFAPVFFVVFNLIFGILS